MSNKDLFDAQQEIAQYKAREHLYQIGNKNGYYELIKTERLIKEKSDLVINQKKELPKHYIKYISQKYGADGTERRKVIKNAFKVIFDNVLPDMHKIMINYNRYRKTISREEIAIKMKKLKATKKAVNELEGEEKLFFELMLAFSLDKDQKKEMNQLQLDLDGISGDYKRILHELIEKRNELLQTGRRMKVNVYQQLKILRAEQIIKVVKHVRKFEQSPYLKFHELWSVKKKTQKGEETKENIDDVELTASEDLDTEYLQSADKVEGYLNEFKEGSVNPPMKADVKLEEMKEENSPKRENSNEEKNSAGSGEEPIQEGEGENEELAQIPHITHCDDVMKLNESYSFGKSEEMFDYPMDDVYHSLLI